MLVKSIWAQQKPHVTNGRHGVIPNKSNKTNKIYRIYYRTRYGKDITQKSRYKVRLSEPYGIIKLYRHQLLADLNLSVSYTLGENYAKMDLP